MGNVSTVPGSGRMFLTAFIVIAAFLAIIATINTLVGWDYAPYFWDATRWWDTIKSTLHIDPEFLKYESPNQPDYSQIKYDPEV